ncbi:MAG: sensor histidine kinase [Clostridia bacterium]|nr:sensor histidine kinase [Clostridia bacterium]
MLRDRNMLKIGAILKLFTYITTSAYMMVKNDAQVSLTLVFCITLIFFNTYFRQYHVYEKYGNSIYSKLSIIIEIVLITYIGLFDKTGVYFIYYMPIISESNMRFSSPFSIFVGFCAFLSGGATYFINEGHKDLHSLGSSLLELSISFGVAIVFTFSMSYLVKLQVLEKDKLQRSNNELEQAYKILLDNAAKIQELSVEKERTRMAREIHDTLAHTLTAAIVQMEACKKLIDVDLSRAREEIINAQQLTRDGLNDVKRTIKALRPQMLENRSFFEAVLTLIKDTRQNTNVQVDLNKNISMDLKLEAATEVALFRIIQESITNSIRHGNASRIRVDINHEANLLKIHIGDDGKGCSYIKKGYGLRGITERIEALQGVVKFSSLEGKGFETSIQIPL